MSVRPGKKFGFQSAAENLQWRRWPNWLWQTVPDRCSSCWKGAVANGRTHSAWSDQRWSSRRAQSSTGVEVWRAEDLKPGSQVQSHGGSDTRPQILFILDLLSVLVRTKSCGSASVDGCAHSLHISATDVVLQIASVSDILSCVNARMMKPPGWGCCWVSMSCWILQDLSFSSCFLPQTIIIIKLIPAALYQHPTPLNID